MRPPLPHVDLPFLIVHGRAVWIATCCALSAITIAVLVRRRSSLPTLLAIPFVILLGQCAVGHVAYEHVKANGYRFATLSSWSAVGLAAAAPLSRDEMLHDIDLGAREPHHTRQTLAFSAAWLHFHGECFAEYFFQRWELDAALEDALRCGETNDVLKILNHQGRFSELVAVLAAHGGYSARFDVKLGDWRSAAAIALKISHDATDSEKQIRWKCFAALLETYAGDAHAFVDMPRDNSVCTGLASVAYPHAEVSGHLLKQPSWLQLALDAKRGALSEDVDYDELPLSDTYWTSFLMEPQPGAPHHVLIDHRNFKIAMLRGNFTNARRAADAIANGAPWNADERAEMLDELALHAGTLVAPAETTRDWRSNDANALLLRQRVALPSPPAPGDYVDEQDEKLFADALLLSQVTGDATPLVEAVRSLHEIDGWRMSSLLGVAPQLRRHTHELMVAVWDQQFIGFGRWNEIDDLWLRNLADLRDLARLLGQSDDEATLQGYIDRQVAPYDDLRKVTALWLFDHLDDH